MERRRAKRLVMVACPDARPPAYQAVVGLNEAGLLERFVTSTYYNPESPFPRLARHFVSRRWAQWERHLLRRYNAGIPANLVSDVPSIDLLLRIEALAAGRAHSLVLKRTCAQARTVWFDHRLSRLVARYRPSALLVFSDVASGKTLPLCRRLGIPTVLSMVHGDVREEIEVLDREAMVAPDFFPIYLGDGLLDRVELDWLHRRRKRDITLADMILVPSVHIADRLVQFGISRHKIRVIPYAADCARFRPPVEKVHTASCNFLFAGGITQRKGIKYLLEAWNRIRRPDWTLQLLGSLPRNIQPLASLLPQVQLLGRVSHEDVPSRMAAADVFVFPSLFEGSAVVTYEALASGLPSVVTPASGSVIRQGIEGFLVPPGDVRAAMSKAARARSLDFDWPRYHTSVTDAVLSMLSLNQEPVPRERIVQRASKGEVRYG
jgi:glycosyltransferase involved in cell wall biosynthesis